jgi:metallo-beta-lactamase class B
MLFSFVLDCGVLRAQAAPITPVTPQNMDLSKDGPFPAYRIIGNVYFVGSKNLCSFLIKTDNGLILINSGFEQTVPLIQASIEKLGFRMQDVKVLLASHAHPDHIGGNARMKMLTGARVLMMDADVEVARSGGKEDFQFPNSTYTPSPIDGVLHDGDQVKLGGVVLVAHKTPGHTKGCTTWTLKTRENGHDYNVVIVGSINVNAGYKLVGNAKYPTITDDFAYTYRTMKTLPCDVALGAHPFFYNMEAKYVRLQEKPAVNPFIDPEGYRKFVDDSEKAFLQELTKEMTP